MNSIKASEFKAKCLKLMDQVAQTCEPLVITKNGKPVATLVPYGEKRHTLAGLHAGAVHIHGDIISPLDEPWEALN
ncbi:MAG: type II toxin-antitoxin system Phd/YefM family antitoxin [Halieaceae bacterium]|nr:type II toxin-antitoxin system Phd/YefM family antitoxin [Halieaceae bacterium]